MISHDNKNSNACISIKNISERITTSDDPINIRKRIIKTIKIEKLHKKNRFSGFLHLKQRQNSGEEQIEENKKKNSTFSNHEPISDQKTQNHNCEYKPEIKKTNLTIN
jgi:hypothetical protein